MNVQEQNENILTTSGIVVEMTLLVAFTAGLVWYYQAKDVPLGVSACVFLSWLLGFAGTLLLPADIVLTLLKGEHSLWMTRVWYTVYWTTFLLAWVVLPILYQSWQAGELTWMERLRSAVRLNVKQYLLMALAMLLFVIYLVIRCESFHVDTDKHDSMFELEAVERSLDSLERAMETKKHWHLQGREHLQHMLKATRKTEEAFHEEIDDGSFRTARFSGKHGSQRWDDGKSPAEAFQDLGLATITPKDVSRIHSDLRAAQVEVVASRIRWAALLQETDTLLCVVNDEIPWGPSVCESTPGQSCVWFSWLVVTRIGNRAGWVWRAYLRSPFCRALAFVCAGLSGLIIWSEVVAASRWNLSPFGILLRCMYEQEAGVAHSLSMQAAVLVPFLYMSLCCYRSLFTLRIFGAFRLQGGHHTLPSPLLFNAQYLIRLQFPLGYNFMRILRYAGTERERELHSPAFQNLMNDMSTVPVLGTGFNVYAPMVLVVLCMFTFFKGYARVLRLVGLDHEDLVFLDDPDGRARVDEGRGLVERGKRHAQVLARRRQDDSTSSPSVGSSHNGGNGYTAPSLAYSKIEDAPSFQDPEESTP
eukprot:jgi/Undpi1/480/HiC_scaffold_10.g03946.m1